jgi:hypothetical protein
MPGAIFVHTAKSIFPDDRMRQLFVLIFVCLVLPLHNLLKAQDVLPAGMEYITSGITMRMISPVTAEGKNTFQIQWVTNQIYPCSGYELVLTFEHPTDRLNFYFKGIRKTETCAGELAPAISHTDLSFIKPGKYRVFIWINKQLFKASLEVTATGYTWTMDENPDLLRMLNPKLLVIPEGMVWGKCEYRNREFLKTALAFVKDLKSLGATERKLQGGDYGEFYVYSFGFEELPIEDKGYEYPFYFQYTGDKAPVQKLISTYYERYGNDFRITFGAGTGERIHSWDDGK